LRKIIKHLSFAQVAESTVRRDDATPIHLNRISMALINASTAASASRFAPAAGVSGIAKQAMRGQTAAPGSPPR